MISEWDPVGEDFVLAWLEIDWLMFAPFVEIGGVAEKWSISDLHRDMNWCAGVGVRAMARHVVLRLGTAASEEGMRVEMMVMQSS